MEYCFVLDFWVTKLRKIRDNSYQIKDFQNIYPYLSFQSVTEGLFFTQTKNHSYVKNLNCMSIIQNRQTGFSYKYDDIFTCPGTGNLFPEKNKTSTGIRHCQLLKNQCCEKSTFPVCRVFILPGLLCLFPGTFRR